jgi:N-methylhydantoinase A
VATPLGLELDAAAAAIVEVATERMVSAIEEVTLQQGIDPRASVLVGGGGAAGLNAVAIARRLRCPTVVIPEVGPALSAAGALMSELATDFAVTQAATTAAFDAEAVNIAIARLRTMAGESYDLAAPDVDVELSVEARYPHQVWDIEVPVAVGRFDTAGDVDALKAAFHATHQELFAVSDPGSEVELLTWRLRAKRDLRNRIAGRLATAGARTATPDTRLAYFSAAGVVETRVVSFEDLEPDVELAGPLIVESDLTTVVVDPGAALTRTPNGSLRIALPTGRPSRRNDVEVNA